MTEWDNECDEDVSPPEGWEYVTHEGRITILNRHLRNGFPTTQEPSWVSFNPQTNEINMSEPCTKEVMVALLRRAQIL